MTAVPADWAPDAALPGAPDDARKEIRTGLLIMAVFFGGFGGWAALAPLDAAVVAPGVVTVSGSRQTVQHQEGGIVSRLLVREDARVEKGQVLLELSTSEIAAQEEATATQVIELEAFRARLLAEASGASVIQRPAVWANLPDRYQAAAATVLQRQQAEMQVRRGALDSQIAVLNQRSAQLGSRIQGYNSQIASVGEQSRLIQDEVRGVRMLAEKGLVPLPRLRALERSAAELQGRRGELSAAVEQAREGIGESRLEAISAREQRAEEREAQLRQVDTQLAELYPTLRAVREQLERSRVRAPATGRVVGLTVFTEGGVIRAGDTVMDIVPENQPLVIEAQVSPTDVDDLKVGQRTEVRFSSLGGRDVPMVYGEVTRISADRFEDERTGAAYFKTQAVVPPEELARLQQGARPGERELKSGLPVEVVVPLRKRTALQYLTEPLNQRLWRSFREQ